MGSKSAGHGGDREGGGVDANIAMLEKEHEEITKVQAGGTVCVAQGSLINVEREMRRVGG